MEQTYRPSREVSKEKQDLRKKAEAIYIAKVKALLAEPPFRYSGRLANRVADKVIKDGHLLFANATEGSETDGINDLSEEYKRLQNEIILVIRSNPGSPTALSVFLKAFPALAQQGTLLEDVETYDQFKDKVKGHLTEKSKNGLCAVICSGQAVENNVSAKEFNYTWDVCFGEDKKKMVDVIEDLNTIVQDECILNDILPFKVRWCVASGEKMFCVDFEKEQKKSDPLPSIWEYVFESIEA